MPVLPAVDSTTSPPGLRSPRFSASRIIHLAARSLTDWPGFMNSALPRMVQPVSSEARLSLMSGVLPIASTTSLLNAMSLQLPVRAQSLGDPKGPPLAAQAGVGTGRSTRFRKYDLTHVDVSGQEPGLAIGEVIFPQPPETVIEARWRQVGPGRAEIASPDRKRPGIILPENALADNGDAEALAERLQDLRRRQHAARKHVALDE